MNLVRFPHLTSPFCYYSHVSLVFVQLSPASACLHTEFSPEIVDIFKVGLICKLFLLVWLEFWPVYLFVCETNFPELSFAISLPSPHGHLLELTVFEHWNSDIYRQRRSRTILSACVNKLHIHLNTFLKERGQACGRKDACRENVL